VGVFQDVDADQVSGFGEQYFAIRAQVDQAQAFTELRVAFG
jgi:hypothetical protein